MLASVVLHSFYMIYEGQKKQTNLTNIQGKELLMLDLCYLGLRFISWQKKC